jgi:NDP-sugar pyrophosphorylase family protein
MSKKLTGFILSKIYDNHEKKAFLMPLTSEKEKSAFLEYKAYGLDIDDFNYIEKTIGINTRSEKNDVNKRFYFYSRLFFNIIKYKIQYLLQRFGL